jgi:hypothetical protein
MSESVFLGKGLESHYGRKEMIEWPTSSVGPRVEMVRSEFLGDVLDWVLQDLPTL